MRLLFTSAFCAPPLRPAWVRGPEPGWEPQAPLSTESAKHPSQAWLGYHSEKTGPLPKGLPAHYAGWGVDGGPVTLLGMGDQRGTLPGRASQYLSGSGFHWGFIVPSPTSPNVGGEGAEGKRGSSGGAWGPSPLGTVPGRGSAPERYRTQEDWTPFPALPHPQSSPFCSLEKTLGESRASGVSGNPRGYGTKPICPIFTPQPQPPTLSPTSHPNPDLPPKTDLPLQPRSPTPPRPSPGLPRLLDRGLRHPSWDAHWKSQETDRAGGFQHRPQCFHCRAWRAEKRPWGEAHRQVAGLAAFGQRVGTHPESRPLPAGAQAQPRRVLLVCVCARVYVCVRVCASQTPS